MTHEFLSEDWFKAVADLRDELDVELPEKLRDLLINVIVEDVGADVTYRGCWFEPGHDPAAKSRLHTNKELLYKVMVEKNMVLGVRSIATGDARLVGERSKLLKLRAVRPSPSQDVFENRIKEMTTL